MAIKGSRLLVIAAHPDDEVLGCGGLLAANAAVGGEGSVLVVSEGSSAQNGGEKKAMTRRHDQLLQAAEIVGASEVEHWSYPDMRLDEVPHLELNGALQNYIAEKRFDTVLVHHPFDVNRDHQIVYRSALVACRPAPHSPVDQLFTYHVNSSTEWAFGGPSERFCPTTFVDISSVLDKKLEALAVYEEELREYPHPRSLEAVRNRALVFGSEAGLEAAEAFQLVYSRER